VVFCLLNHRVQVSRKLFALQYRAASLQLIRATAAQCVKVEALRPLIFVGLEENGGFGNGDLFRVEDAPLVDALIEGVDEFNIVSACRTVSKALHLLHGQDFTQHTNGKHDCLLAKVQPGDLVLKDIFCLGARTGKKLKLSVLGVTQPRVLVDQVRVRAVVAAASPVFFATATLVVSHPPE
jgi:hypothetical protein